MRKLTVLIVTLFWGGINAFAGEIPEAVTTAFAAKFPKAEKVKWSTEMSDYEAEFVLNGVQMSAHFSETAKWTQTESGIAARDLPKGVTDYVSKNHPNAKITEAATIARPSMDVLFYKVEIKEAGKETDLILTANGILTK